MRRSSANVFFSTVLLSAGLLAAACAPVPTDEAQSQGRVSARLANDGGFSWDLGNTTGNTNSCSDLIDCTNPCTTAACELACIKRGTASAQHSYKGLSDCIAVACPQVASTSGTTAACTYDATTGQFVDPAACNKCYVDAQQDGGACTTELATCNADGGDSNSVDLARSDSDGGIIDNGNQSVDLAHASTCSEIIECGNACTTFACTDACIQSGAPASQSLYNALSACVETACPTSSGGICESDAGTMKPIHATDCDKCVSDSQMAGGSCSNALIICNNDV